MPARPKPDKPRNLRLAAVDGQPKDSPEQPEGARAQAPITDAPPAPAWLPESARAVWDQTVKWMIGQRTWLPVYEPTVAAFSCLYAELMASPLTMQTARVTQFRLLAGDLGFSPSHVDRVRRE